MTEARPDCHLGLTTTIKTSLSPPPLWAPDVCARPCTARHKEGVQRNNQREKIFSDMSWAPFTVADRRGMKRSTSPQRYLPWSNFWLARGHRGCSPAPGSLVIKTSAPAPVVQANTRNSTKIIRSYCSFRQDPRLRAAHGHGKCWIGARRGRDNTGAPQMNVCGHHWAHKNNSNVLQPTDMTFASPCLMRLQQNWSQGKVGPKLIRSLRPLLPPPLNSNHLRATVYSHPRGNRVPVPSPPSYCSKGGVAWWDWQLRKGGAFLPAFRFFLFVRVRGPDFVPTQCWS